MNKGKLRLFDFESSYLAEKESFEYPTVSYIRDIDKVYYMLLDAKWVDLGLPSGTLWATCNVGASKPEEYGLYFAWGETEGYSGPTDTKQFAWSDYKLCNGSKTTLTKYNNKASYGTVDNLETLELVDDAAYVSDNTCRIPTRGECQELIDNTTRTWTKVNGVYGITFTSTVEGYTDKSIFIPAAGFVNNGSFSSVGKWVYIWSSSLDLDIALGAHYSRCFQSDSAEMDTTSRFNGYSVRPVKSNN